MSRADAAGQTFALGLIGSGIGGSLTPALHEHEARRQGFGLTYRLLELDRIGVHRLPEVLEWVRLFGLDGVNVTYPVKQAVLPYLDEVSPQASRVGAVNTVVVRPDGTLVGHNTDAPGFTRALLHRMPGALRGTVVQVGAGGAGSAIAHAMLDAGLPHLLLVDVDADRRSALAASLLRHHGPGRVSSSARAGAAELANAGGLVNATPVGMTGHPGVPVDVALLRPDLWVADAVYSPLDTELVLAARRAGAVALNGSGMAVHQAADAFEIFTGRPADRERMARQFLVQAGKRGY